MSTVAIIQARMGSSRLPGKVLRRLQGTTVLGQVIRRARAAGGVDEVVVAIPEGARDDVLVEEIARCEARVERGSETDVLGRYYEAARAVGADRIVRITSDCPLLDPQLLDKMIEYFNDSANRGAPLDYLNNTTQRTFPRGLDIEIFTMEALRKAHECARSDDEREHVTPYIYRHPELFSVACFTSPVDLSHHRWTLDTAEDWELIARIYDELGGGDRIFPTDAVLAVFERRPELFQLNASVRQKEVSA